MKTTDLVALVKNLDAKGYNLVSLVSLRKALVSQGFDRTAQDQLISSARKNRLVCLAALEGRHGTTPEELTACVREHGEQLGFVSLR